MHCWLAQKPTGRNKVHAQEQDCSAEMMAVRQALIEGEASGEPKKFDIAAFKQRMLARQYTHNCEELGTSTSEDVHRTLSHR
jgi:Arc/MetJ-type ribon-helix-helix transcriptional regulator